MMDYGFLEAFSQVLREKRLERELLIESLEAGLASAVKKKYGANAVVDVQLEEKKGVLTLFQVLDVVEETEIEDPSMQISLEDARLEDPAVEVGGKLRRPLNPGEFGRNAIQTAKQVVLQRVREAERGKIYEEYSGRVGEIVSGKVQQVDRGDILVNLGRAEAILPREEQIRIEHYHQGDTVRAFIQRVEPVTKGPQIFLSRRAPEFLVKLFEQEVPEIYDGLVEIRGVAREAGGRSKIAVYSRDDRIDAVGACVGMKGSRVQSIVRELSGEKIDIVPWDDDLETFVSRALAPATISGLRVRHEEKAITVIVKEDQLSQAIGRDGQNVRLAAKLSGWKIDLVAAEEMEQRERLGERLIMDIGEMAGVTDRLAAKLEDAGYTTVQSFVKASPEDIMEIPGIGPKTVEKLTATARETMRELDKILEQWIEEERLQRAEEKKKEEVTFDFDEETTEEKEAEPKGPVDPFAPRSEEEEPESEESAEVPEPLFSEEESEEKGPVEASDEKSEDGSGEKMEDKDVSEAAAEEVSKEETAEDEDTGAAGEEEAASPEEVREVEEGAKPVSSAAPSEGIETDQERDRE
jgi:N utilization substance protein A